MRGVGWLAVGLGWSVAFAQTPARPRPAAPSQTESDAYTRYELLAVDTAQFRIDYEVTATAEGARFFFNPIRKGSQASDEAVYDAMTGQPLRFEVVDGAAARRDGLLEADAEGEYIKIFLARPVPPKGGGRLLIHKIYKDPKSYYREGNLLVFSRSLGIKRNAVVLPPGYEIVACNVPAQVLTTPDGRIASRFYNIDPEAAPLVVKARALSTPAAAANPGPAAKPRESPSQAGPAPSYASRLAERARQDRSIVYFLKPPDTHSFSLYHDYTESREGTDRYLNVVRQGSHVSDPKAWVLDTGEVLPSETLKGEAIGRAGISTAEPVNRDTEIVVIRFPRVQRGQSIRLRIEETYTDPVSYFADHDELIFDRSFGRPRNAVVLPSGWYVTASSLPAVVTETDDGRIRVDYNNPRPDTLYVLLKAKPRSAAGPHP